MKKGDDYQPPLNRPFYSKETKSKMYSQIEKVVQNFNGMDTLKESIHSYSTQKNEALNQCIARVAPKFKHFGATLTLQTRIFLVIAIANEGYSTFYGKLLPQLVNLNVHNQHIVHNGIQKIEKVRQKNMNRKASTQFKRARKHKIRAKIKEQVYEERISKEKNYGTYESGFNFECEPVQINEEPQQTTIITATEMNDQTNEKQQQKKKQSKQKYCKWCNKYTNHLTRQSKSCLHHDEWLQEQKNKKDKTKNKLTDNNNKNDEEKTKKSVKQHMIVLWGVMVTYDGIR